MQGTSLYLSDYRKLEEYKEKDELNQEPQCEDIDRNNNILSNSGKGLL